MRAFLSRLGGIIAAVLACTMATLPSCASMGGGGMKGMLAQPTEFSAQSVSM